MRWCLGEVGDPLQTDVVVVVDGEVFGGVTGDAGPGAARRAIEGERGQSKVMLNKQYMYFAPNSCWYCSGPIALMPWVRLSQFCYLNECLRWFRSRAKQMVAGAICPLIQAFTRMQA